MSRKWNEPKMEFAEIEMSRKWNKPKTQEKWMKFTTFNILFSTYSLTMTFTF